MSSGESDIETNGKVYHVICYNIMWCNSQGVKWSEETKENNEAGW